MSVSFTGRVVKTKDLNELGSCIESQDIGLFYQICQDVLTNFRHSIESETEFSSHPLSLRAGNDGNKYFIFQDCIELDFNKALRESKDLNSSDLLLGSLGHELGHFYVKRLSKFYRKDIHGIWNELMADFTGGFLFGLDQDNDLSTRDLNLEGRRKYFPYLCKKYNDNPIPGSNEGYYEGLDGIHPFCALRIGAIEKGFIKGCSLKDDNLPLGLTKKMAEIYDEFMDNLCDYFNTNHNIQHIVELLLERNKRASVIPPFPKYFLK